MRARSAHLALVVLAAAACAAGRPAPVARPPSPAPETGASRWRYTVTPDAALERLRVRLCFEDRAPARLAPHDDGDGSHLLEAATDDGREVTLGDDDALALPAIRPGQCVRWTVDLASATRSSRFVRRRDGAVLLGLSSWLWGPPPEAGPVEATVVLDPPEGVRAAAPWGSTPGRAWPLPPSAFETHGFVAFGDFGSRTVAVGDSHIELVRLGDGWTSSWAELEAWIHDAASTLAQSMGGFPAERLLVVAVPSGGRSVRFGLVRRGGGPAILFVAGREGDVASLGRGWVTLHELTHLMLPRMVRRDIWMSEGIATYYQEVLRTRRGTQTPTQAWENLLDGFRRGRRDETPKPLYEDSTHMKQTRDFYPVYWAGTAYALELDVRLRAQGAGSLDRALARAAEDWGPQARVWQGREITARLDEASGSALASRLYEQYRARRSFPEIEPLLERLGVRRTDEGGLVLRDEAPLSAVREAITARSAQRAAAPSAAAPERARATGSDRHH